MGKTPPPIPRDCWIKYLQEIGCSESKGTKHDKWVHPKSMRPFMMDRNSKEIPFLHAKTNLSNIGITMSVFKRWAKENC